MVTTNNSSPPKATGKINIPLHCTVQLGTVQYSSALYYMVLHCTLLCCTVSTVHCSGFTVLYTLHPLCVVAMPCYSVTLQCHCNVKVTILFQ